MVFQVLRLGKKGFACLAPAPSGPPGIFPGRPGWPDTLGPFVLPTVPCRPARGTPGYPAPVCVLLSFEC